MEIVVINKIMFFQNVCQLVKIYVLLKQLQLDIGLVKVRYRVSGVIKIISNKVNYVVVVFWMLKNKKIFIENLMVDKIIFVSNGKKVGNYVFILKVLRQFCILYFEFNGLIVFVNFEKINIFVSVKWYRLVYIF